MMISVFGIADVLANLAHTQEQLATRADDAVQHAGQNCERYARQISPVLTGEMRDGFQYVNNGPMSSSCLNDVLHSLFVELGTYKMAAQPTLFQCSRAIPCSWRC